jgi:hypothetical protein
MILHSRSSHPLPLVTSSHCLHPHTFPTLSFPSLLIPPRLSSAPSTLSHPAPFLLHLLTPYFFLSLFPSLMLFYSLYQNSAPLHKGTVASARFCLEMEWLERVIRMRASDRFNNFLMSLISILRTKCFRNTLFHDDAYCEMRLKATRNPLGSAKRPLETFSEMHKDNCITFSTTFSG